MPSGQQAFPGDFDPLAHSLTALVYDEDFAIGGLFRALADRARDVGLRLGGVIEREGPPVAPGRHCAMFLEELAGGEIIAISQDRGALARGCRLDLDALTRACALVLSRLRDCDAILLNKFGKTEAEGGGFRCIISDALTLGIPIVVGVPRRNLVAWREFSDELATEYDLKTGAIFRAAAKFD